MNDPDADFYFDFSPDDIYVLYQCVCKRLEKWEGGHPQEQEKLFKIRDNLYRCVLHYKFNYMDVDE